MSTPSAPVTQDPATDAAVSAALPIPALASVFGETTDAVTDHRALFVHSGLVDQLRDTTATFLAQGVDDRVACDRLAAQFEALRLRAAAAMDETAAADLPVWAPALPVAPSIAVLHAAASMLARWIDQVHAAPQYLTQHRMATVAARRVIRELGAVDEDEPGATEAPKVPPATVVQAGLYL